MPVENNDCLSEPKFKPAIGFYSLKYKPGDRTPAIRCFTHAGHDESSPTQVSGLEEPQLDAGLGTGIITTASHRLMARFAAAQSARGYRWPCAERLSPFPTTARWNRA